MNEDLYDTGSAVVGLYRLFTNFFKIPWGIPRTEWSIGGGGGGGGGVLGITAPFPSYPSFLALALKNYPTYHRNLNIYL